MFLWDELREGERLVCCVSDECVQRQGVLGSVQGLWCWGREGVEKRIIKGMW